ncbi:MAG: F0F1 ATP synthase subunit A [Clostridia bacterium]|nr:F0F1 ATP synthase subunit A [Clostridia bacterium]
MNKTQKRVRLCIWIAVTLALLIAALAVGTGERHETVTELMKDAVLHETNQISLFGLMEVNPAVIAAFTVSALLLLFALIVRIFVIPRFQTIPGRFQMLLETAVDFFDGFGRQNSPHRHKFLGAYLFGAGAYLFIGTLFELLGIQVIATNGHAVALPAPLSDINGAIAMGCASYLAILSGGIASNGIKGIFKTLKEFSLPISMSFRLFGALLSGLLVTELVYYYVSISFVLPVLVAVLFTLLHALIQTYVLIMLTSMFYGEVSEVHEKKPKKKKAKKDNHKTKHSNEPTMSEESYHA